MDACEAFSAVPGAEPVLRRRKPFLAAFIGETGPGSPVLAAPFPAPGEAQAESEEEGSQLPRGRIYPEHTEAKQALASLGIGKKSRSRSLKSSCLFQVFGIKVLGPHALAHPGWICSGALVWALL